MAFTLPSPFCSSIHLNKEMKNKSRKKATTPQFMCTIKLFLFLLFYTIQKHKKIKISKALEAGVKVSLYWKVTIILFKNWGHGNF